MIDGYFSFAVRSAPLLAKGAWMTLKVLSLSSALSFIWGTLLGVLSCKRLRIPYVSAAAEIFSFTARGIPFFLLLLIVYFVLPDLLGMNFEPFFAAVLALGVSSSGYVAQMLRGALDAIPAAQWEAAQILGYSTIQRLRHVILPQAMRMLLPQFNNELDSLLKSTAIVSSIGLLELTRMGMNIVSREMDPAPVYLTLGAIYLFFSAAFNRLGKQIEKRFPYVKN